MSEVSLFDVENEVEMPKVRDMHIGPASTRDVHEFARRYHYARGGGSASWRWGLWHGVVLHGVVAYNLPTRSVCASVFGEEHLHRVWHMGRLVLSDESPRNSESRLIAGSLRAIAREHPDIWSVITYASADVGHLGYVYQATNALYCGAVSREGRVHHYIDRHGMRRATHLSGAFVSPERASQLGWTEVRDRSVKHRYLYLLGSRAQRRRARSLLRWPVLPYPKVTDGGQP